jgi:hypothetical protein
MSPIQTPWVAVIHLEEFQLNWTHYLDKIISLLIYLSISIPLNKTNPEPDPNPNPFLMFWMRLRRLGLRLRRLLVRVRMGCLLEGLMSIPQLLINPSNKHPIRTRTNNLLNLKPSLRSRIQNTAAEAGFEVEEVVGAGADGVLVRGVDEQLGDVLGARAKKWVGVRVWFGVCFVKRN